MFSSKLFAMILSVSCLMMCNCQIPQPGFGNEGFGAANWGEHYQNNQAWGGQMPGASEQERQNYMGMGGYPQQPMSGEHMNMGAIPQGMPAGGPIPTLQGPPQAMFQQVQSMFQQRLAAGQCMDNPMFADQCEMYAGMGYCTPAYSHANGQNSQVQQQLQWIYENCPESCGLCIEAEV